MNYINKKRDALTWKIVSLSSVLRIMRSKVVVAPPSQDRDSCCVSMLSEIFNCCGTVKAKKKINIYIYIIKKKKFKNPG